MKVILPVAGKGTRLRPHTLNKPKSLVRVAGKTIFEHVIASLAKVKCDQYILITDENGQVVENFQKSLFPNLPSVYIQQQERLGPAHAVWLAKDYIHEGDDVLIVFNDTLFITDLTRIPRLSEGLDGLIYSKEVEDYRRFGVNVMKNGLITDMVEKPDQPISRLAQVGLYYIKDGKRFMGYLSAAIEKKLTVKGEYYLPEVFKLMLADGMKLGAPEIDEWLDCGKTETLLSSNRFLLEHSSRSHYCIEGCVIIPPVSIHPSAHVNHSVIGPHVSIAEGCNIENSIIKDTVVNSNSIIKNVIIEQSLIGDSVELSGGAQRINIGDNSVIELGVPAK
ncbi:MAG: NTP transferase domain-containing protein [Candidatus Riflebacteria bacterium]|nr:NTP transferase domain-containing protein [Candidatus Riflebacteria bacterium]